MFCRNRAARCRIPGHGGTNQHLHFRVVCQQIKTVRVSPRAHVKVDFVAKRTGGHHRIILVLVGELDEAVEGLAVDDRPVRNPPNLVFSSLYLQKPAAVLQNFKRLPIHNFSHPV